MNLKRTTLALIAALPMIASSVTPAVAQVPEVKINKVNQLHNSKVSPVIFEQLIESTAAAEEPDCHPFQYC